MGLDLCCNDVHQRCGSYSFFHRICYLLVCGLKEYLETETTNNDDKIDYLCSLLFSNKERVQYNNFDYDLHFKFDIKGLGGFFPFIFHSDSNGTLSSGEAEQFMRTFDIVKDYIDSELKDNDEFYLQPVFSESIDSGNDIHFC